jgi:hypothetical protein
MAILTDILIASPSEAEAICAHVGHFQRWPCLQWKGVDNLLLADLLAALGAEADAKALRGVGRMIYWESEGGPWVFHLPDTLPTLLAKLEDEKVPEVVERWMQGEQLSFDARAGRGCRTSAPGAARSFTAGGDSQ